jgi:peptide/nickel transport system permease protein
MTVFGVVTAAFFLVRLAGDPALLLLSAEATQGDIEAIREAMGLNRPLIVQYFDFIVNALQGDFGVSTRQNISAMSLVLERIPATLELALTSFAFGIILAFVLGTIMRMTRAVWLRHFIMWDGRRSLSFPSASS